MKVLSAPENSSLKMISLTASQLERGNLLLVNERHPLRQSVAPDRLTPFFGSQVLLERRTALVLENLFRSLGCAASVIPVSGYRTLDEQKQIYASSLAEHGEEFTRKYVALPGCSEHQTGLAIDLALNREPFDFIRPYFPKDGICGRFREKMISYGFVERYPEGKEAVTGIAPEPWHFRYVGLPHGAIMERHGFCLEEYIDYLSLFPAHGRHLEIQIQNKNFEIFWLPVKDGKAEFSLPQSLPFQVSGTNTGGCVVTLWK